MSGMTLERNDLVEATHRGLARVWIDFESALVQVPLIARMLGQRMRAEEYRRLLVNLRQQVVEGSRWISRAASNLGPEHEELRSLFVRHAVAEHRDYRLLEDNYVAAGGQAEEIRSAPKNIGSEALSAFMYQAASRADPVGLLGAMFVIEGLGERLAGPWSEAIKAQLGLGDEAVSFLAYHGANDGDHLDMFDRALALAVSDARVADDIVRHAKIVARLYRLQLEEIDNV
ncbi:3-oxoacyl-ACP synthase [Sphingomonas oligophenolica]|uniref:Iron-containing redox enzyme family protein n=1 Tax=Sphingomonas oligophenolica TaxID=301154 RepID=A0ABU9Y1H7_9SPHN